MTNVLNLTDSSTLTTQVFSLSRTKYFPIEFYATGLYPNTNYNAYYNGILINAFCKQFGKNLGAQLVSDQYGKLVVQVHVGVPYNQTYLVNNTNGANNQLSYATGTIELQAPNGSKSITYVPFNIKAS